MTRVIDHLLNTSLEVWREAVTTDAGGGQTMTRSHIGDEPVRVSAPADTEREVAQRERVWITSDVYCHPAADVVRGDELREPGLTLRVLATVVPSEPIYRKAVCESIQPGPT